MTKFGYIRDMYDSINKEIFDSSFVTMATVYIHSEEIAEESTSLTDYGDILDGRQTDFIKRKYPDGLKPFYRIKVYPIEKSGLKVSSNTMIKETPMGMEEPYDMWISCFESEVKSFNNKSIFDFAESVQLEDYKYIIKRVIQENFGNDTMLHVFMEKSSNG